jgi:hypothetical protein
LLKQYQQYFLIALAALIITIPALVNGFPFIFMDTIDYIVGHLRIFRPPAYGIFASISRELGNIWLMPIIQGLIVGYVIYYLNKVILGQVNIVWYLGQIIFLTLFSSLPYFSAFIIADIFTPILFLTFFILVFYPDQISGRTKIFMSALFIFSSMAHVSNIYLGIGLLILAIMIEIMRGGLKTRLLGLGIIIGGLGAAIIVLMTVNMVYFKSLSLSPSAPTYMLANLVSQGVAKKYLQNACPSAGYKICEYVQTLPSEVNDFIWERDGIVISMGGFKALNKEAKIIVKNTLLTYPQEVAQNAFTAFVKSFGVHTPGAEITNTALKDKFPKFAEIYFGSDTKQQFLNSAQNNGTIPYGLIKSIDGVMYPLSFVFIIIASIYFIPKYKDSKYLLPLFTLAFICGNNFLCAVGSGLFDRYQARVSWLMVLTVLLCLRMLWGEKMPINVTRR